MNRSTIAALLAAFLAAPAFPQDQPPTTSKGIAKFSTTRQLVVVDVTAKDKDGKPIKGLKPTDFNISEDGKKQDISVFEYQKLEEALAAPLPVPAIKKPAAEKKPAEAKADAPAAPAV